MTALYQQLSLLPNGARTEDDETLQLVASDNSVRAEDRAIHNWYRFVLSFPPHLVRRYLDEFSLQADNTVLDPFCGTGTTVVEARLNRTRAVGLEANPFPHFASTVKTSWDLDPDQLLTRSEAIAEGVLSSLRMQGIDDIYPHVGREPALRRLTPEAESLLISGSISPLPLHKTLVLLDALKENSQAPEYYHQILALGSALVNSIGNLRFGPEVGIGKIKQDFPVISTWLTHVRQMADDLSGVRGQAYPRCTVFKADARQLGEAIRPRSVDAVITSPPYPNEKDYTRTTRLETVVLGFISTRAELRALKQTLVRSNTRGVYLVGASSRRRLG